MKPGIFESIFPGKTVEEKFAELATLGFRAVQFDLESAGLATIPDELPRSTIEVIRAACVAHGVEISALSGTYNMIGPDLANRVANHARFLKHIKRAPELGTRIVTICTGTRDPQSMWRKHPNNQTDDAWNDLVAALAQALEVAERSGVVLGIEPEPANVINTADRARRLIEEMASRHLGIIADPANLLAGDPSKSPEEALSHVFDLLGDRIVLAHGKDISADGEFTPAGRGVVPWKLFLGLLRQVNYRGSLILHSLTVDDIPHALETLRDAELGTSS
jgi:sugar phosphate isomerase/epimerase